MVPTTPGVRPDSPSNPFSSVFYISLMVSALLILPSGKKPKAKCVKGWGIGRYEKWGDLHCGYDVEGSDRGLGQEIRDGGKPGRAAPEA